jgi:hypothetical protein
MLPIEGCRHAGAMNATGEITYKNMVYTEYFASGTEPSRTCTGHIAPTLPYAEPYFSVSDVDSLGDLLSVGQATSPGLPVAPAEPPLSAPSAPPSAEAPPSLPPAPPESPPASPTQ